MTPGLPQDLVVRAMTDDGAFRVVAARTTQLTQTVVNLQQAQGQCVGHCGDLLTSAVLIRETMAPNQRVQAILTNADRSARLVADAHPGGGTRGLLTLIGDDCRIELQAAQLEVMRTMYSGQPHRGVVEVPPQGGVSEAVMAYMATSEQVASMIALATVEQAGAIQVSGGYLVQLLPEVGRAPLEIMAARLQDFQQIGPLLSQLDGDPKALISEILYGMPYTILEEESPVNFQCTCSAIRVLSSLATLGRDDLAEMVAAGEAIDVNCDYCNQTYSVSPRQLGGLLDAS